MVSDLIRFGTASPLYAQFAMVLVGLTFIALAPPESGRMIAIPLSASAADGLLGDIIDRGALPLGGGPLPASHVVVGERVSLFGPLLGRGVLLVASPFAGCGTGRAT